MGLLWCSGVGTKLINYGCNHKECWVKYPTSIYSDTPNVLFLSDASKYEHLTYHWHVQKYTWLNFLFCGYSVVLGPKGYNLRVDNTMADCAN